MRISYLRCDVRQRDITDPSLEISTMTGEIPHMANGSRFPGILSAEQEALIVAYLQKRRAQKARQEGFSVVYDLTYWCNLRCRGCAVNARYTDQTDLLPEQLETTTEEVCLILDKIERYLQRRRIDTGDLFIDFGGGEPFLRQDFIEILKVAESKFGPGSVGFDTNGTVVDPYQLVQVAPLVDYIGVSVDGLEEYHNWWRHSHSGSAIQNCYRRTMGLLSEVAKETDVLSKLEVTTVVTTLNMSEIPALMKEIHSLGVRKYSVHRPMPVGRMQKNLQWIPSAAELLRFSAEVVEVGNGLEMEVHLHHSLEGLYSAVLLGQDTIGEGKTWCQAARASIGVDPTGRVYFCPWCIVHPLSQFASGSLLDERTDLEKVLHEPGGFMDLAREMCTAPYIRCRACPEKCSGGCRVAAMMTFITEAWPDRLLSELDQQHLLLAMQERDPACPIYL